MLNNNKATLKTKTKDPNRGFKISADGKLIISDKGSKNKEDSDDDSSINGDGIQADTHMKKASIKRGLEEESSDGKFA